MIKDVIKDYILIKEILYMEFTLTTLVVLVVVIIVAIVLIGLAVSWGSGGQNMLGSFFDWLSGGSKPPQP